MPSLINQRSLITTAVISNSRASEFIEIIYTTGSLNIGFEYFDEFVNFRFQSAFRPNGKIAKGLRSAGSAIPVSNYHCNRNNPAKRWSGRLNDCWSACRRNCSEHYPCHVQAKIQKLDQHRENRGC